MRAHGPACVLLAWLAAAGPVGAQTVRDIANQGRCSVSGVVGLSQQLAETQRCLRPGQFVRFDDHPNVIIRYSSIHPYLQASARAAVHRAADSGRVEVNSAFRPVADQYVLYHSGACGLAAAPGRSNHQSGRALDLHNWSARRSAMQAAGCAWLGDSDPVHFDCPGSNLRADAVLAFQILWNINHPEDRIAEDGSYGPQTDARLRVSPAAGFPRGGCASACDPAPESCNGGDDDCDGRVDEGLARACGSDVGACEAGTQACSAGAWGACVGGTVSAMERCDGLDDDCDGIVDEAFVCELDELMVRGARRTDSDIDGDGRADACAIVDGALECLLASGHGFERSVLGPAIGGEGDPSRYGTLRMGDVDGDGLADACARGADGVRCWMSDGRGFGAEVVGPPLTDAEGFDRVERFTSLRMADVDGDGANDLCARWSDGLRCYRSTDRGFVEGATLTALADDAGFADPTTYGTLRMGDLDGDGRDDVCARSSERVWCWVSTGVGFGSPIAGPEWSDAAGYGVLDVWSTIQLADVDGDGRAELCARTPSGFECHPFDGHAFGAPIVGPRLEAADGWDAPSHYATLRLGDVDGDGRADLCGRARDGVICWLLGARGFDRRIEGPRLSDDAGWVEDARYRTLRLADVTGDGRADLCARAAEGLRCWRSNGSGFPVELLGPDDAEGWEAPERFVTLRIGGGAGAGLGIGDGGVDPGREPEPAGCGCRVGAGASAPSLPWAIVPMVVVAWRRRRRRCPPRRQAR